MREDFGNGRPSAFWYMKKNVLLGKDLSFCMV